MEAKKKQEDVGHGIKEKIGYISNRIKPSGRKPMQKIKPKSEEGLLAKTKRRMNELFWGEKTYLPGHKKRKITKQTTRTTQTEKGLKTAGLTEDEINRLKGKK